VPNGVYEVSLYVKGYGDGVAINGCHAQGTRLRPYPETESSNGETFSVPDGTTVTQRVHVRQGRLRIGASPAPPESDAAVCSYINKLSFARVGGAEALPQAWIPDAQSPWQQLALAAATPIGVVTVTLPEYTGCAHTWLFDGNSCVRGARSIGAFLDTASQGKHLALFQLPLLPLCLAFPFSYTCSLAFAKALWWACRTTPAPALAVVAPCVGASTVSGRTNGTASITLTAGAKAESTSTSCCQVAIASWRTWKSESIGQPPRRPSSITTASCAMGCRPARRPLWNPST